MKTRDPTPLRILLRYCGVLFLLTLLGAAVLLITDPEPTSDEYCASSASHLC